MQKIKVFHLYSILMLVCILISSGGNAAAAQPPLTLEVDVSGLNTIKGVVLVEDGSVPELAKVIAWQDSIRVSSLLATDGSYSLNVGAGDWLVLVAPLSASAVSPDWVFTEEAQPIHFDANPDPVSPIQGLDFTVSAANATIQGSLVDPEGGSAFAAPNRVWVRAQNQEGQGNTVLADALTGAFSIHVLPGSTLVKLNFENPLWAPPLTLAGSEWFIEADQSMDVGALQLVERKARIGGKVSDELGNPVADIVVRAWRVDGALTVKGKTNADGMYLLPVLEGVWEVQVVPSADSPYVAAQSPVRVFLPVETAVEMRDLEVVNADVRVNGMVVDQAGQPVTGLSGHVYALYPEDDRWPQFGTGAPILNSAFTLKLSSSLSDVYRIKSSFPATAGYTALSAINLNVQPGDVLAVTLPVAPNNSTISGQLIDFSTNLPKINLPGAVYGASNSGAVKRDLINPLDASYLINAVSTDLTGFGGTYWWLKGFVDPTTGWVVMQPRTHKVFLPYNEGEGADVISDFYVAQVNSVIRGVVLNEFGQPAAGVRVTAIERYQHGGASFRRWTETNADGFYRLLVPAGQYRVTADFRNWISPIPAHASACPEKAAIVNLVFRPKDATISGVVSYNGAPHAAFIRAYSNKGAHVVGLAGLDGRYALHVNSKDTWYVQAVGEENEDFLRSERIKVHPLVGDNPGADLTLVQAEKLPKAVVLTFDASQYQTLTLSNGAQVIVPAGALALSGEVSISARPLKELSDDGGAQPVSFGYRLHAFDAELNPIDHFNSSLTLVMPFTAQQLAELGVDSTQLVPSYWDQASASWKPVPNFSVMVNADGGGSLNMVVNHFTDYALLAQFPIMTIFMPVINNGN